MVPLANDILAQIKVKLTLLQMSYQLHFRLSHYVLSVRLCCRGVVPALAVRDAIMIFYLEPKIDDEVDRGQLKMSWQSNDHGIGDGTSGQGSCYIIHKYHTTYILFHQ